MKHFIGLSLLCLALILASCDTSGVSSKISSGVSSGDAIYVYTTDSAYPANFGNRSSAIAFCEATYSSNASLWDVDCTNYVAILSYYSTPNNQITDLPSEAGLPEDLPLKTIDGVTLGNDFSDFLDSTRAAMTGTGISHSQVWTGFDTSGGAASDGIGGYFNCQDWSTSSSGQIGNSVTITSTTNWHNSTGCTTSKGILCACWN